MFKTRESAQPMVETTCCRISKSPCAVNQLLLGHFPFFGRAT